MSGLMSYYAGCASEETVARHYMRRGLKLLAQRWRGAGGEIDLVFKDGPSFVFVEVKKSKTHDRAVSRVSRGQMNRIMTAALDFAARRTGRADNHMRFDVATMDQTGDVRILENAFATA